MSSAAAPTSQAPVTAPATTAEPTSAPAPATSSPNPAPTSQAPQTTAQQTTAAPASSSTPAANSPSSTSSNAAASSSAGATPSSSTPAKASSSPSASKASFTSSISFVVQTSDGQVFTQTSVVTVPASQPSESQSTRSSAPSFFHNTGAVAGVFSVVGIIAIVLIFILLTTYVRRRRARKFDREIDEAAAVAAAAQAPDFDDFDYTSGTGIGYAQYSETSHGTYNQPPLSHERSRNNLGDIPSSYDNSTGGPAGAAGIGARGRSLRSGMQDPFGALSNPPEQYEMTESSRTRNQGSLRGGGGAEVTTYDMLQAAGMSGSDPYAVTRAPSTRLANLPMQSGVSGLMRSQSQGTTTLPTTPENYPMSTAAPAYPGSQDRSYPPEKARYSGLYTPAGGADVYSGYQDQPSASLDNPHSPGLPAPRSQDEHEDIAEQDEPSPFREEPARASLADDEDYGYSIGNRVLRVANE